MKPETSNTPGVDPSVEQLYVIHAELCKALSHPKRLQILDILADRECNVDELAAGLGVQSANVSQHLAVMRRVGLVQSRKEGLYVYYRLADPRIKDACNLLREIMVASLKREQRLIASLEELTGDL